MTASPTVARARSRPSRDPARASTATSGPPVALLGAVVGALVLFGLAMVLSASSVVALAEDGSTWSYFSQQVQWAVLGAVALVVFLVVDRSWWRRLTPVLYGASLAGLLAVLVPGLGVTVNGATRWLAIGPFQVQPSEFSKLAVILAIAHVAARGAARNDDPRRPFWVSLIILAGVVVPVLLQPNLGTALVIGAVALVMLFAGGLGLGRLAGLAAAGSAAATFAVFATPFRRQRFFAFLDPWADPSNTGYQNLQALVALGSGGWFGLGLGASRAKWEYLPFAQTDFIFAIIGEELGLLGASVVVALFLAVTWLGIGIACRAEDRYSMLLATGITTWISAQAFLNIGMVIGLLPITGVPLPFVSFGGSSLLVTMASVGLLLNIARRPAMTPQQDRAPRRPGVGAGGWGRGG